MRAHVKKEVELTKLVSMGFTRCKGGYKTHVSGSTYVVVNTATREIYFTGPFGDHNRDIAREKDKGIIKAMDEKDMIYYTGEWRNKRG